MQVEALDWVDDLKDPTVREQILQASGNVPPPDAVPQGLERLSSFWTAPMPDYAASFLHNEIFGYSLSALMGTGLILALFLLIAALVSRRHVASPNVR